MTEAAETSVEAEIGLSPAAQQQNEFELKRQKLASDVDVELFKAQVVADARKVREAGLRVYLAV